MANFLSTDPITLLLDANGDLDFSSGTLKFATGLTAIAQRVTVRIRLFMTEWFLNLEVGMNWFGYLGEKYNEAATRESLRKVVLDTPGVTGLTVLTLSLDSTRLLTIGISATTVFGDIVITTEINNGQ